MGVTVCRVGRGAELMLRGDRLLEPAFSCPITACADDFARQLGVVDIRTLQVDVGTREMDFHVHVVQ